MVRRIATALVIVGAAFAWCLPADAGNMHQGPGMRKNQRRMCPDGKPMHGTRTGRTVLYGCD